MSTLILLLTSVMLLPSEPPVDWKPVNVINWFEVQYFAKTDKSKVVTKFGHLYQYNETDNIWERDTTTIDKPIRKMHYSDTYEYYAGAYVLRNVFTGERRDLSGILDTSTNYCPAFGGDTIAFQSPDSTLLYSWKQHGIIRAVQNPGWWNYNTRFALFGYLRGDTLYTDYDNNVSIYNIENEEYTSIYLPHDGAQRTPVIKGGQAPDRGVFFRVGGSTIYSVNLYSREVSILRATQPDYILDYLIDEEYIYYSVVSFGLETAKIYRTHLFSGETMLLGSINSLGHDGTGRVSCAVHHVNMPFLTVGDAYGGLYRYNSGTGELRWFGNGIYEQTPRTSCSNDNYAVFLTEHMGFVMNGENVTRMANPMQHTSSVERIAFYGDSLLQCKRSTGLFIWDIDQFHSHIQKADYSWDIESIDSVFFYSPMGYDSWHSHDGTYRYSDGHWERIFIQNRVDLQAASERLVGWTGDGELMTYTFASGAVDSSEHPIYKECSLIAALDTSTAVVLRHGDELFAYDYDVREEVWRRPIVGTFLKGIRWHGRQFVVCEEGDIIDVRDGTTFTKSDPDIREAVVFRDTCYLFYDQGRTLRGVTDKMTEAAGTPVVADDMELELFPMPMRREFSSQLLLSLSTAQHIEITLHDVLGRSVATIWSGTLNDGRHLLPLHAPKSTGLHFIRVRTATRSMTRPLIIVP